MRSGSSCRLDSVRAEPVWSRKPSSSFIDPGSESEEENFQPQRVLPGRVLSVFVLPCLLS